jgi:outer membrane protein assembly factor BamB
VSAGDTLYLMNTKTGQATQIGSAGSTVLMAYENGAMYAASYPQNAIYALNTSTGAATFIANVPGAPSSFEGLAPGALLNANPNRPIRFASENVGKTSGPKTVTLTNTGATSISIAGIFASAPFAQSNTCGSSIAVNSSCTVSVTFTPAAVGGATGALQIDDDASGNPQTIPLSGTGN